MLVARLFLLLAIVAEVAGTRGRVGYLVDHRGVDHRL